MNRIPALTTKITGSNNYFFLTSLNINGLNSPIKRYRLTNGLSKQDPNTLQHIGNQPLGGGEDTTSKEKAGKQFFMKNGPKKQAGIAILISNTNNFQPKVIKKDKDGYSKLINGKMHQDELPIFNIYAPNERKSTHIHKRKFTKAQSTHCNTQKLLKTSTPHSHQWTDHGNRN
jgi:exonuclease III